MNGVFNIFSGSNSFEIGKRIILRITIDMIDIHAIGDFALEESIDDPVNRCFKWFTMKTEINNAIPVLINRIAHFFETCRFAEPAKCPVNIAVFKYRKIFLSYKFKKFQFMFCIEHMKTSTERQTSLSFCVIIITIVIIQGK